MDPLSMKSLIDHFKARLHQLDNSQKDNSSANEPKYPMAIIYLGKNTAKKAHTAISNNLFQLWPPYKNDICFWAIDFVESEARYFDCDDDEMKQVDSSQIQQKISKLLGLETNFKNRERIFTYYIMDTQDFYDENDLQKWSLAIKDNKNLIQKNQLSILNILLDENLSKQNMADKIKNNLALMLDDEENIFSKLSIFLLSNQRNDGIILENLNICYQIITNIMALSNYHENHAAISILEKSIKTVAYSKEEKPLYEIGYVIVNNLISNINSSKDTETKIDINHSKDFLSKLGLSENGTFIILDKYVKQALYKYIPTEDEIMMFPRSSYERYLDNDDILSLSMQEFNTETMGTWNAYFSDVLKNVEKQINQSSLIINEWKNEYKAFLKDNFTNANIEYLNKHIEDIKLIFKEAYQYFLSKDIIEAAKDELKQKMSQKFVDVFVQAIVDLGNDILELNNAWNNLLKSKNYIIDVNDDSVVDFYNYKAQAYFDRNKIKIISDFNNLKYENELDAFMKKIIDEMINKDEIYTYPFEEELAARTNREQLDSENIEYISSTLTGENLHTYLTTALSLPKESLSAILLKENTALYKSLKSSFNNVYFYNTGRSNSAELMKIYEVSKKHLLLLDGEDI